MCQRHRHTEIANGIEHPKVLAHKHKLSRLIGRNEALPKRSSLGSRKKIKQNAAMRNKHMPAQRQSTKSTKTKTKKKQKQEKAISNMLCTETNTGIVARATYTPFLKETISTKATAKGSLVAQQKQSC